MKNNKLVKGNFTAISRARTASILELRNQILNLEEPIQQGDYNCYACRRNPNCYILIVDQSEDTVEESEVICDVVNSFISDSIYQCTREDEIRDLVYLYIIIHQNSEILTLDCAQISNWKNNFFETEIRQSEELMPWGEKIMSTATYFKWVLPSAKHKPNLTYALQKAYNFAKKHIEEFPNCFPPIVYNITTFTQQANIEDIYYVNKIKSLKSKHGNCLFLNLIFDKYYNNTSVNFPKEKLSLGKHASFVLDSFLHNLNMPNNCIRKFTNILKDYKMNFVNIGIPIVPNIGGKSFFNSGSIDFKKLIKYE